MSLYVCSFKFVRLCSSSSLSVSRLQEVSIIYVDCRIGGVSTWPRTDIGFALTENFPMLAGNLASIGMGGIIATVSSLIVSENLSRSWGLDSSHVHSGLTTLISTRLELSTTQLSIEPQRTRTRR